MTTQKVLKYQEILLESQQSLEEQEMEYKVEEAKLQLKSDILATKKSIISSKAKLKDVIKVIPFSPKNIIDSTLELESYENGLKALLKLEKDLF